MNLSGRKPKGVIFDFDGVIVDSIELHLKAWDIALKELWGKPLGDPERIIGMSTVEIALLFAREAKNPGLARELAALKRQRLREFGHVAPLLPGVREFVEEIKKRSLPFGIASNAPKAFIHRHLQAQDLAIDIVIGVEDVTKPKPDPEPYNLCAKVLGFSDDDKKDVLIFEDSVHGLTAAIRSGMIAVGVKTHHSEEKLKNAGAHLTCRDLQEVLHGRWLDELPL